MLQYDQVLMFDDKPTTTEENLNRYIFERHNITKFDDKTTTITTG